MRTLYLTRHAKSSWDDPGVGDFHRPLNDRGRRDAPVMAQRFAQRNEPLDLLLSSPAERAITTARIFAQALARPASTIKENKDLYLATHNMLLRLVNLLPADVQSAMFFGHNPGMSELVEYLSDADVGEMPTCATARIDFLVDDWAEVSMGLGELRWYDYPKREAGA